MRSLSAYSFANAKVRAMLGDLLSADKIEVLAQTLDYPRFTALLKDYFPADILYGGADRGTVILERNLRAYDIAIFKKVSLALLPKERTVMDILLEEYSLEDVKKEMRKVCLDGLRHLRLEDVFSVVIDERYRRVVAAVWDKAYQSGSLFYIETALEQDRYNRLRDAFLSLSGMDRRMADKIISAAADIENASRIVRLQAYHALTPDAIKETLIPYGRVFLKGIDMSGGFSGWMMLEGALRRQMVNEARRLLRGMPFHIGTILGYLILRQNETKNIITIANSKNNRLGRAAVERLVIC